ncbi:uncharacterized protein DFL_004354 [Arthrobotrys flagrans]|uniref:Uncharacterized protein n=1 Tax=Arthrobotrys flagrans TaxID=97331 RepID=A0A437A4T5_ARTFL|nr:hypothetical protein DFL_004354 [Arthrobotrys flagrans]
MPYNLSRWASYPRFSEPPPALIAFLKSIKDSKDTVYSGSEAQNILTTGISSASVSQQLRSMNISALLEDGSIKKQSQPTSEKTNSLHPLRMASQQCSNGPETSISPGSSDETFETAKSENLGCIDSPTQKTKSKTGSKESTPASDTEKPGLAVPFKRKDTQQIQILRVAPPADNLSTTPLGVVEPVPATLGNKHSSRRGITAIFHGKGEQAPPVPPKPAQYVPVSRKTLEGNDQQPAVQQLVRGCQPAQSMPPTMLIFQVLGTGANPDTRKFEYHLLYKWSGNNPCFPNGPVIKEAFTFEDLSMHRAVVTRLRVWHSTHIGVSKDPRVEEMRYRLSPAEYTDINRHPWPPFNPRGWYRCLIWGHFGVESGRE